MIINVQEPREARKLMTINVQLMIINVQNLREAPKPQRSARMFKKTSSAKRDVNNNYNFRTFN